MLKQSSRAMHLCCVRCNTGTRCDTLNTLQIASHACTLLTHYTQTHVQTQVALSPEKSCSSSSALSLPCAQGPSIESSLSRQYCRAVRWRAALTAVHTRTRTHTTHTHTHTHAQFTYTCKRKLFPVGMQHCLHRLPSVCQLRRSAAQHGDGERMSKAGNVNCLPCLVP